MTRATVRTLRPRSGGQSNRGPHDHPVTAKITNPDFDVLTALGLIDQTGPADQIRDALNYFFTVRMRDANAVALGIERARARQEAMLAVLSGSEVRPVPGGEQLDPSDRSAPLDKPVTLRIDGHSFDMLTAFALIDEVSLADVLRKAITSYIAFRKDDPNLAGRLEQAKRKYDTTMSVLATGSD